MRAVKSFVSFIDSTSRWSGKCVSFLVLVAAFQVTYEVVVRYVFNAPTNWGLEMTIFLCLTLYLIGGAYTELQGAHIRIDFLYGRFTPRIKAIVNCAVVAPLFFISCGVLVWAGGEWTWRAWVGGLTSASGWNPILWPVRLLIPLGAFLLLLQGLAGFIRDLNTAIGWKGW